MDDNGTVTRDGVAEELEMGHPGKDREVMVEAMGKAMGGRQWRLCMAMDNMSEQNTPYLTATTCGECLVGNLFWEYIPKEH